MKLRHLVALSATLFTASFVNAADVKTYTPSFCEVSDSTAYSQEYYEGSGYIINYSTTKELRVICPVVRVRNTTLSGSVGVVDYNASTNARCTLWAANANGSGASGRVAYSSGASSTYQDINITSFTASGTPWRDAYLDCRIPARDGYNYSKFLRYTVTEN